MSEYPTLQKYVTKVFNENGFFYFSRNKEAYLQLISDLSLVKKEAEQLRRDINKFYWEYATAKGIFVLRKEHIYDLLTIDKLQAEKQIDKFFIPHCGFIYYDSMRVEFEPVKSISWLLERTIKVEMDINKTAKKFGQKYNVYYRGQAANRLMKASLYRSKNFVKNESKLMIETISTMPTEFSQCPTLFEKLVKLKHYNLPSRLLDLTSTPLTSLYFACEAISSGGARDFGGGREVGLVFSCFSNQGQEKNITSDTVGMLSAIASTNLDQHLQGKELLSKKTKDSFIGEFDHKAGIYDLGFQGLFSPEELKNIVVVHPPMNNPRINNQQGLFLLIGVDLDNPLDQLPIEFIFQKPNEVEMRKLESVLKQDEKLDDKRNKIKQIIQQRSQKKVIYYVDKNNVDAILNELDSLGINKFSMYPELDHLTAQVIKKYIS